MSFKYAKYTVACLLITVTLVSCKKFLDEKADPRQLVFKSLDDLQALLDANDRMNGNTPGFGETSADDYFLREADFNGFTENERKAYTWNLREITYDNDWAINYAAVYTANYVLDMIGENEQTAQNQAQYNTVKGSALFHRAYRFLWLVWEVGKAYDEATAASDRGIALRLTSDFNVPSVISSVKESYDRVIKDAMEAATLLPDHPQHVMRPSKAAAYGLLARTYLSMRKYDSAYKYAGLALQIKDDLLDYNNTDKVWKDDFTPFREPFNAEIIFFSTQSTNYYPKLNVFSFIDTNLVSTYNGNDIRSDAFFLEELPYYRFKGNYNTSPDFFLTFTGIATDEMYLTRAEASLKKTNPDLDAALNDLNTLLSMRYATGTFTPVTAASTDEAIDIVLLERRKELVMRGLRWIDIKRLNKEGANIELKRVVGSETFILPPNDDRYALPIPVDLDL